LITIEDKKKVCEVCGSTKSVYYAKEFNMTVCGKHYNHLKEYGHIRSRTRKDKNEIVIYDEYAEIVLYDNKCNEKCRAIIDVADISKVKDIKWSFNNVTGYVYSRKPINIFLHRLIMDCPDNMVVDHISHNKLDNRKNNLRICTQQENMYNTLLRKSNKSGYKGIFWSEDGKYWMTYITVNKKRIYLGYFADKEQAIKARKEAEIKYFGGFSCDG
jgi:hypothetical protein